MRTAVFLLASLVVAAACAPQAGRAQSPPPAEAVTVELFQFKPARVTTSPGRTVVWTNEDDVLHTVTAGDPDRPSGLFDARLDGRGATFRHTFLRPGTYRYFCARHTQMRGEVVVR